LRPSSGTLSASHHNCINAEVHARWKFWSQDQGINHSKSEQTRKITTQSCHKVLRLQWFRLSHTLWQWSLNLQNAITNELFNRSCPHELNDWRNKDCKGPCRLEIQAQCANSNEGIGRWWNSNTHKRGPVSRSRVLTWFSEEESAFDSNKASTEVWGKASQMVHKP
jgi:hypothetical protein